MRERRSFTELLCGFVGISGPDGETMWMLPATPMKVFINYRDAAKMKGLQIRTFRKRYVDTGLIAPIAFHVPGGKKNHLLFLRVNVEKLK